MDSKQANVIKRIERKINGMENFIIGLYKRSEGLRKSKTHYPAYKTRIERLAADYEAAAKKIRAEYLKKAETILKTTKKNLPGFYDTGIQNTVINGTYYEVEKLYDKAYALYNRLFKRYDALQKTIDKKTLPIHRRK